MIFHLHHLFDVEFYIELITGRKSFGDGACDVVVHQLINYVDVVIVGICVNTAIAVTNGQPVVFGNDDALTNRVVCRIHCGYSVYQF